MNKSSFLTAVSLFLLLTTLVTSFNIHEVLSWTFWKYNTGDVVSSVAISLDGNYTVAATEKGHVLLLDRQGNLIWSKSLGNEVEGVSISGDGSRILAGVAEYSTGEPDVFLLNKNGDIIWQKDLIQSGRPCSVPISQDSNYFATGDTDNRVRFFDSSGNQLWEKELGDWATSVSLSSAGVYLAAGSWDDNVYFFNKTGSQLWSYDTEYSVYGVSISPEGGYVASIGSGIFFFDGNGNQLWNTTSPFGESVSVSVNGNHIAAGSASYISVDKISLLNKTGGELWNWDVDSDVSSVAITSDGKFVAAGVEEGFVYFIENLQPTSITCEVSKPKIVLGEEMPVSGSISPPIEGAEVTLTFTRPDNSTVTANIPATVGGIYNGTYVPDTIGFWTVQAFWAGDAEHMGGESPIILFSVGESTITCEVSNWQAYFGEPITVSGAIDPLHVGVEVTLTYTNPADTAFNRTVMSMGDGSYSDPILPDLGGMWSVQASWSGDNDTLGAASSKVKFLVSTVNEVAIKIGQNQTYSCVFKPAKDYYYSPLSESIAWDRSATSPEGINFTAVEGIFHYESMYGLGGTITSFNITYNIGVLEGTSEGVYNATAYYDISSQSKFYPYPATFLFRYELRCRINAVVKYGASINLSLPPQVKLGEVASVSGTIVSTGGPPAAGVNVTLAYTKPDESVVTRISMTEASGAFQDAYIPDMPGTWSAKVSWTGDEDYNGTESLEVPFNVLTDIQHQVTLDMGVYFVHTISNSTISNFNFNRSDTKIGFSVSGLSDTKGFCNVTIPGNFMWGEFTVFIDGSLLTSGINYTQIYTGTNYLFYILYSQDNSSHEVKILATKIIPEFPSFLILPIFMIATLTAIVVCKRKRARH
jgi:hypothetical protein